MKQGKLKINEDMYYGLENAPTAVHVLVTGKNIGKVILQLEK